MFDSSEALDKELDRWTKRDSAVVEEFGTKLLKNLKLRELELEQAMRLKQADDLAVKIGQAIGDTEVVPEKGNSDDIDPEAGPIYGCNLPGCTGATMTEVMFCPVCGERSMERLQPVPAKN
jgi:hypothetical protein